MACEKHFTRSAPTKMGNFQLLASPRGLRAIYWPGQPLPLKPHAADLGPPEFLKTTACQLANYFAGKCVKFTDPLDLSHLSPFAQKVYRALIRVPYGQTTTYGQLARQISKPTAGRAVGAVLARNPLPIIIPCHRVVRSDGSLGGYSAPGGPAMKGQLLAIEHVVLADC